MSYPEGSSQQQVTGFGGEDDNDWWIVKGAHDEKRWAGTPVHDGELVRLEHRYTRRNLHSHEIESPVTGQQEVSCYGDDGEGDENDNWRVLFHGDKLLFCHALTGKRLHSHGEELPEWGAHQNEVTCYAGEDDNDFWRLQRVATHVLTWGVQVKLQHVETGCRLHSHGMSYPEGSSQQQVTGFGGEDDNDWWIVKGAHDADTPDGMPVPHMGVLRLMHKETGRNLHSHEIESPVTGQQEVSCYGDDGEGDENDNWVCLWEGDKLKLLHRNTDKRLHSHGEELPEWGAHQNEVTCYAGEDDNDFWRVQEMRAS